MPSANRSSRTGSTTHPGRLLLIMALITAAVAAWALWPGQDNAVRLGLDLRGGTQVILQPKAVQEGATITDDQLAQTVQIIRQRVDGVGVAEAEVTVQGSGDGAAIVVSVPDVSQERLVELVGRTALLDFRPVWSIEGPAPQVDDTTAAASVTTDDAATSARIVQAADNTPEYQAEVAALDCLDPINQAGGSPDDPKLWLGTCDADGVAKYSLQPAFIQGTNVTDAVAQLPQQGVGGWVVSLTFDSDGARALAEASQELYALPDCVPGGASPCNAFAIVLDGVVVSAPRFNEPIIGGQAQIEGDFSAQEAQDLANVLSYGALPVNLEVVEVTSVSPTIGGDQLRAGLIAGAIGFVLIVVFCKRLFQHGANIHQRFRRQNALGDDSAPGIYDGFFQTLVGIASWNEFLSDKSLIANIEQRLHDWRIIDFLFHIQFATPRIPGCVHVTDVVLMFVQATDHVPVHDLDMVDIKQQLHSV